MKFLILNELGEVANNGYYETLDETYVAANKMAASGQAVVITACLAVIQPQELRDEDASQKV